MAKRILLNLLSMHISKGFVSLLYFGVSLCGKGLDVISATDDFPLSTVDISGDSTRQVVIAQGTEKRYHGHPSTVLLPDGKTIFCVWNYEHGGSCGPLKRSDDGGKTWSHLLDVPTSWYETVNCPTIYRLSDPDGKARLVVYAGKGDRRKSLEIYRSYSEDNGNTWSEMSPTGVAGAVMPFCSVIPINEGKCLLGMSNLRREGKGIEKNSNIIAQSVSIDGGLSWGPWRIIFDPPDLNPCEPELVRSPDGEQLLCLLRENDRRISLYMTSDDEGKTWTSPRPVPIGLNGDRHIARYAKDGRLVVCFRDTGKYSPTRNHFVAWIGDYDNITKGGKGQYRIKLLHSYRGKDCGYPGVEVLPDGTFVATTYIKYREDIQKNSIVSTRFNLEEIDELLQDTLQ